MLHIGRSVTHVIRYFVGIDAADTQTTQAERLLLEKYAAGKNRVVEIGVFEGVGTRLLANCIAAGGHVYGVDPFSPGRLGICWGKLIARAEVRKSKTCGMVTLIEEFSFNASATLDGEFDMVFIDGDHSLDGIKRDWEDWSPRIVNNGIVALHDTRVPPQNPDVAQLGSYKYFESYIRKDPRFTLCEQVDSLSIMRRLSARE
jgi:predicted O-methyltransferase YrrM